MKKFLLLLCFLASLIIIYYFHFQNFRSITPIANESFITSNTLPAHFDGTRVVHISDLMIRNERCLQLLTNVIELVNELQPDVIFFTGNLLMTDGLKFAREVQKLISDFEADLMMIAVLGYHDLKHEELTNEILTNSGFRVLTNSSVQIFNQSVIGLNVIGVHPLSNSETINQLFTMHVRDDRYNIVLNSSPTYSTTALEHDIPLQLSGSCLGRKDNANSSNPCFQFYDNSYFFGNSFRLHVNTGLARFENLSGLINRPVVDSFILVRDTAK